MGHAPGRQERADSEYGLELQGTPNDEVEPREASPTNNEADLSKSSTPPCLTEDDTPRSLEPIVRCHVGYCAGAQLYSLEDLPVITCEQR